MVFFVRVVTLISVAEFSGDVNGKRPCTLKLLTIFGFFREFSRPPHLDNAYKYD